MRHTILPGLTVVALAACVSTNATVLDHSVRPMTGVCPEGVRIYLAPEDIPDGAVKVALLKSKGDDDFTSAEGMINSQRKKAAQLGANGLILMAQKDASTGAKVASYLFGTSQNRKGEAVALWVPDDTTRVRQICSAVASATDNKDGAAVAPAPTAMGSQR